MNLIKEAFAVSTDGKPVYRYVIRNYSYSRNLAYFDKLDREIFRDFGDRRPPKDEIDVVHYGGPVYKGTFGIEFNLSGEKHPAYTEVKLLEEEL